MYSRGVVAILFLPYVLTGHPNDRRLADDSGCSVALSKDMITSYSTDQQKYAYLSRMSREEFEESKKSGSAGLSIPFVQKLIEASANWDEFQQKRSSYFQEIGYSSEIARETRDVSVVTSPLAYPAWTACMMAHLASKQGLGIWKEKEDEQTVTVTIRFASPGKVKLTSDLVGGTVAGAPAGKAFKDGTELVGGGSRTILVRRTADQPMTLSVTGDQYAGGTVSSEFRRPPTDQMGRGTLIMTVQSQTVEPRGSRTRGDYSNEMHDKSCEKAPCSDKWQAQDMTFSLEAAQGRQLRNASVGCTPYAPQDDPKMREAEKQPGIIGNIWRFLRKETEGACSRMTNASAVISADGRTAIGSLRATSRRAYYALAAEEIEIIGKPQPVPRPVLLFRGSTFVVAVPKSVMGSVLKYSFGNGEAAIKPGDKTSADQQLELIGLPVDAGDEIYYTYRVKATG